MPYKTYPQKAVIHKIRYYLLQQPKPKPSFVRQRITMIATIIQIQVSVPPLSHPQPHPKHEPEQNPDPSGAPVAAPNCTTYAYGSGSLYRSRVMSLPHSSGSADSMSPPVECHARL